jgi:hypothetical protein
MKTMIQFFCLGASIYCLLNFLFPAPLRPTGPDPSGAVEVTFQEVTAQSGKALNTTAAFMRQEKKRISAHMAVTLHKLDQGITHLRHSLAQASAGEKPGFQQRLNALQSDRIQVTHLQSKLAPAENSDLENLKAKWRAVDVDVNVKLLHEKTKTPSDHQLE